MQGWLQPSGLSLRRQQHWCVLSGTVLSICADSASPQSLVDVDMHGVIKCSLRQDGPDVHAISMVTAKVRAARHPNAAFDACSW
jgi:hypothetical protein